MVYKPPEPNITIVNAKFCYINNSCFFFKSTINSVDLQYTPWVNNSMFKAFTRCLTLTSVTNINNNVTDMTGAFSRCSAMIDAPIIPNSVTDMSQTFDRCSYLKNVTLPNSVINLSGTFYYCTSLENAPTIPNSVTDMSEAFSSCYNLVNAPTIPNSVTSLYQTFHGCSNITNAPCIPNSIINMSEAFYGTNICGDIYIKSEIVEDCYYFTAATPSTLNVWIKPNTTTWNTFIEYGYDTTGTNYTNVIMREWN